MAASAGAATAAATAHQPESAHCVSAKAWAPCSVSPGCQAAAHRERRGPSPCLLVAAVAAAAVAVVAEAVSSRAADLPDRYSVPEVAVAELALVEAT